MGVVFTATQFQQALCVRPDNDGIDFHEFLEWWAGFHTESADRLLSVNIGAALFNLKEVLF